MKAKFSFLRVYVKVKNIEIKNTDYDFFTMTDIGEQTYLVQFRFKKNFRDSAAVIDFFIKRGIIIESFWRFEEETNSTLSVIDSIANRTPIIESSILKKTVQSFIKNLHFFILTFITMIIICFTGFLIYENRNLNIEISDVRSDLRAAADEFTQSNLENIRIRDSEIAIMKKENEIIKKLSDQAKQKNIEDIKELNTKIKMIEDENNRLQRENAELAAYRTAREKDPKYKRLIGEQKIANSKIAAQTEECNKLNEKVHQLQKQNSKLFVLTSCYIEHLYNYHRLVKSANITDTVWMSISESVRKKFRA